MAGYDDLDNQSFMSSRIPRNNPDTAAQLAYGDSTPPQANPRIGGMPRPEEHPWGIRPFPMERYHPLPAPAHRPPSFVPGAPMNMAPRPQPQVAPARHFTPEDQKRFDAVWNSKAPLAPQRDENAQLAERARSIDPGWHPPGEQAIPPMGPMSPTGPRGPAPRSPIPTGVPAQFGRPYSSPTAVHRPQPPLLSREQAMQIAQSRPPQSPMSMQPVPVPQPATPVVMTQRAVEPQSIDSATYAAGASQSPEAPASVDAGTPPDTRGRDLLAQLDSRRVRTDALRERVMREGMHGGNGFSANVVNPILSGLLHDKQATDFLSKDSENKNKLDVEGRQAAMQAANAQNSSDHEAIADYEHLDPSSMYNKRIEESLKRGDIAEATRLHFYQIQAQHEALRNQLAAQANSLKERELTGKITAAEAKTETDRLKAEAYAQGRKDAHLDRVAGQQETHDWHSKRDENTDLGREAGLTKSGNQIAATKSNVAAQIEGANHRQQETQKHIDTRAGNQLDFRQQEARTKDMNMASQLDKTGQPKYPGAIDRIAKPYTSANREAAQHIVEQYKIPNTPEGHKKLQQLMYQAHGVIMK